MSGIRLRAVGVLVALVAALVAPSAAGAQSADRAPARTCNGLAATIVAGASGVIRGTPGDDVIVGRRGPDRIDGGRGNDVICGRGGADEIDGGPGHDLIYGQQGSDIIDGEGGKDRINGGPDADTLRGGLGRDRVVGAGGAPDECWGEIIRCEIEHRTRHDGAGSFAVTVDVAYGAADGQTLLLDLFEPRRVARADATRSVVVFAHGGGFTSGSKDNGVAQSYARDLAGRGFVSASINYRLAGSISGQAIEMAQHDMQAAVRWFRANATELGIDPDRIFVSGYSAGALAAAYTNYSPDNVGDSGNPGFPSDVAGTMPLAGFANPSLVDPGEPPALFFQGTRDTTVLPGLPAATCNAAIAAGNLCEVRSYDTGHFLEGFHDEIVDLMVAFVGANAR